jgi:type I restriction enzyme S subunit
MTRFLDCEVEKIDRFIAKKRRLISLIREEIRAIASELATVGMSKGTKLRESGIPWLPRIPSHWRTERAKRLFRESTLPVRADDEIVTCFRDGQVTLRRNRREDGFTIAILEGGYQGVRMGQLVIHAMDGFAGAIGVSESDGKCTPEYAVCDPVSKDISVKYYAYLLREMALRKYIEVACQQVRERAPRFRYATFANVYLPVPSPDEQAEIADTIEKRVAKLRVTIERVQDEITLMHEFRASLIAEAITGKIDVRSRP